MWIFFSENCASGSFCNRDYTTLRSILGSRTSIEVLTYIVGSNSEGLYNPDLDDIVSEAF